MPSQGVKIWQLWGRSGCNTINTITADNFDQLLRNNVNRKPFHPFVVELKSGKVFPFTKPNVAFGGGVAGFISEEEGLVNFSFDEVKEIRDWVPETAS